MCRKISKYIIVLLLLTGCIAEQKVDLLEYNVKNKQFEAIDTVGFFTDQTKIQILSFFSYQCPICLQQIPKLNQLKNQYGEKVKINLIFPESSITDTIAFYSTNIFNFPVYLDHKLLLTKRLDAIATPQYFIFYKGKKKYSGAMDNKSAGINLPDNKGKYVNYLESAIDDILSDQRVKVKTTKPVGCFIER